MVCKQRTGSIAKPGNQLRHFTGFREFEARPQCKVVLNRVSGYNMSCVELTGNKNEKDTQGGVAQKRDWEEMGE